MTNLKELRRRLEVQGFTGLTDQDLRELGPWMRFTPVLNTTLAAIGTFFASPQLLLLFAFLMGIGAVFPAHPFDLLYNNAMRFLTHTKPLPRSGSRRRFVFGIGCWWSLITAWMFSAGHLSWGFSMGWALTIMAFMLASANICVISELLHKIFGTPGMRK